jgi:hypothetical protein
MTFGRWVVLALSWAVFLTAVAVALSGGQQACTLPAAGAPVTSQPRCPSLGHPYAIAMAVTSFAVMVVLSTTGLRAHLWPEEL